MKHSTLSTLYMQCMYVCMYVCMDVWSSIVLNLNKIPRDCLHCNSMIEGYQDILTSRNKINFKIKLTNNVINSNI